MKPTIEHQLMAVANNIRTQRLIKNYSQDYLSVCLKISQNAYSKIELGQTRVTIERIFQIAAALNITYHALLEVPVEDN